MQPNTGRRYLLVQRAVDLASSTAREDRIYAATSRYRGPLVADYSLTRTPRPVARV